MRQLDHSRRGAVESIPKLRQSPAPRRGFKINGTKLFNTGRDGARYTISPVLMEGFKSVQEGPAGNNLSNTAGFDGANGLYADLAAS